MSIKKVLISAFVLFLGVMLVACGKKENPAEAYVKNINILNPAAVVGDIQLQKKVSGQGSVTWTSSNEAVVSIEEYADETLATSFYRGKVVRPAVGADDAVLTLTAKFTLDGQSAEKVISIKVLATDADLTIADILDLALNAEVTVTGVVAAIGPVGFLIDDETAIIYVYDSASAATVAIGDTVKVSGKMGVYHEGKQIGYATVTKLNDAAGTYTYPTAIKVTVAELAALYTGERSDFNVFYELTGIVSIVGDLKNIYIKDFENPDIGIYVHYSFINPANTTMFQAKEGAVVTFKGYSVCADGVYPNTLSLMYLDTTIQEFTDTVAYVTVTGKNIMDLVVPCQYTANLFPTVLDTEVVWTTSDAEIATVDATGLVTGVSVGSVDVIATVGGTITNKKTITIVEVLPDPTEVTISGSATVEELSSGNYTAVVGPEGADQAVVWSVGTSESATIDQNGKLTTTNPGVVTITATAEGTEIVGTFEVTVTARESEEIATAIATFNATPRIVSLEGVVVGIAAKGWFLADATGYVYVHINKTPTDITLGDTVRIAATKGQIYDMNKNYVFQIDARNAGSLYVYPSTAEITPFTEVETKTVASFEGTGLDAASMIAAAEASTVFGVKWVEVTGKVIKSGSFNNLFLEVGTDKVMIDYNSSANALSRLEYVLDEEVTLKGLVYGYSNSNGWSITFFNQEGDLKQGETALPVKPDAMIISEIQGEVNAYYSAEVTEDIVFDFTSTLNPTAAFVYESDTIASIANNGTVTQTAEAVDVVITVTVYADGNTEGTATGTVELNIKVLAEGAAELEVLYETGFESAEGFVKKTVYNLSTPTFFGPAEAQWSVIMGAASSTGAISDAQSIQMRSYAGNATLGSASMDFDVANIHKVIFKAKGEPVVTSVKVYYSTDAGLTWLGAETFTLSTTATEFVYNLPEGGVENARIRFENPHIEAAGKLTFDDVAIYGTAIE